MDHLRLEIHIKCEEMSTFGLQLKLTRSVSGGTDLRAALSFS